MIRLRKEQYGWEFLFLGANIDAVETAGSLGIAPDRAVNYHCDSGGVTAKQIYRKEQPVRTAQSGSGPGSTGTCDIHIPGGRI